MITRTVPRLAAAIAVLVPALMFAVQAHAAGHAVTMANYAFSPASETISVGDSVTWTNTDQAPHNVSTTSGPVSIQSPTLNTGQSWSYTFTTPGSYSYICSIHPDMRATLVVRPLAQPTTTAAPVVPVTRNTVPRSTRTVVPSPAAVLPAPTSTAPPTTATPMTMAGASQPASGQPSSLNPLLLVAGLVAAVATFCLLLLGARAEPK